MKRGYLMVVLLALHSLTSLCYGAPLDDLLKSVKMPSLNTSSDEGTVVSGLKEALTIGTDNAVASASKMNGYFGNQAIKILLPDKLQTAANILGKLGYQKQVDELVLTMNRAAEKAAPEAKAIFVDAIKQMTFDDARRILNGGDTAATDYFKSKTSRKIFEAFKPIVSSSMHEVGVTRAYDEMIGKYISSVPFAKAESLDLDQYVTNKATDGLFYMIGEEEKKIRTNPAARVTNILKKVFGK